MVGIIVSHNLKPHPRRLRRLPLPLGRGVICFFTSVFAKEYHKWTGVGFLLKLLFLFICSRCK